MATIALMHARLDRIDEQVATLKQSYELIHHVLMNRPPMNTTPASSLPAPTPSLAPPLLPHAHLAATAAGGGIQEAAVPVPDDRVRWAVSTA